MEKGHALKMASQGRKFAVWGKKSVHVGRGQLGQGVGAKTHHVGEHTCKEEQRYWNLLEMSKYNRGF